MELDYRVLGPVEVWADAEHLAVGGARQRRLLGALVVADGLPVTPERLVDIVWLGAPPDQARNTLRTYVARLRRVLEVDGSAPLVTGAAGYALVRERGSTDSERFESLLGVARSLGSDPIAALASLEEALALWRGPAFGEFAGEDWCSGEAVRLDELRLAAMEHRFDAMLACGLYSDVVGDVERFIDDHPLRERARGQLMLAMYREGRQVEALRLFQDYRRYLDAEVGVEPSADLRALEQRIVARDPSLQDMAPAGRALRGYQLGRQIGQGAFGTIYQASQPSVGREVAIKVVRAELANDPEFIRRFDAEAQIVARLEHPHIVPLFDYWREPGGAYLVMRYLRGGSAEQLLRERRPVSVTKAARLVEEVGSALAAAHARGVVHRDVKPANILFDEDGNSYLADFGIATGVGSEAGDSSAASPVYASPEQVRGAESAPTSDLYALGAVLYELLSGEAPFSPDTPLPDMLDQKLHHRVPSLRGSRPDLPSDIDAVIQRATSPDPADRYADVGEMLVAFRAATSDQEGGAAPARLPISLAAANPYKGLAAFQEADAGDYFGRTALVSRLLEQVQRSRFVAVVGPSGSGKSSLVRAGLMPRLRAGGSYITSIIPGPRPMGELETALLRVAADPLPTLLEQMTADRHGLSRAVARCLPDDGSELVVIVDQFEELFTLTQPAARDEFLEAIAAAVTDDRSRLRVVVTLRADFYDRPLGHRSISDLVQANTLAVTPLAADELERAITGPAASSGVTVEPALTAELIADAISSPSTLPLLQYVLTESFDHREGDRLTLDGYRRLGGISGAVARRADELFDQAGDAGPSDIRMLFTRLISFGEGTEDTRRRVRRSELAAVSGDVIAAYGEARLLSFDHDPVTREPTVEVAHEALIREWPRLRRWLDEDRDGLRVLRHLTGSAEAWEESGRDEGELYRGGRLETAAEWAAARPDELNPSERAFLDESSRARDAESALEQRRVRRLRLLVVSLGVIAVVAIVAGLVAFRQQRVADDNAAEAERRLLENRTSRLVSESSFALVESDPDLAILLALAAHDVSTEISDTPQPGVVAALHEAVHGSRLERIIAGGFAEIAVSPDGRTVALDHLTEKNRLATYDIETGELLAERTFEEHVGGLAYSPDGSLLAVSFCCPPDPDARLSEDLPAMELLDPATLDTVHALAGGVHSWKPSWSTDGSRVLVLGFAGVRVWSVGNPEVEQTIADTDGNSSAVFVPGSSMIALASSGSLDIIDLDTAATVASHQVPFEANALEVSPAGDLVAFIDPVTNSVVVADLGSGESVGSIDFQSAQDIRFAPDGVSLSIAGNSDVVHVASLESGDVLELRGHGTGSWRQAYTPEGQLLVPMIDGGTRVWNLAPAGPRSLGNLAIGGPPLAGRPLTESAMLVAVETGPGEAHVEVRDITSGTSRAVTDFWFASFRWPVFSPDGALAAGFSPLDRIPTVIDVESSGLVSTLRPCDTPRAIDATNGWILVDAWCLDDSPPSASGSLTGFLDLSTGDLIASADTDAVFQAVLGPPGSVGADVVAYTTFNHVVFRRASSLEILFEWRVPVDVRPLSLEFSPDGSAVGLSSQSGQGVIFDIEAILRGGTDDAVTVHEEMHSGGTARVIPFGDSIVTTGGENEVRQWDTATGALLVDVSTDLGVQFTQLFALPDDRTLFYEDADGVLRRFLTDPDDLVELARSRLQRGFTEAECDRYLPQGECPT